HPPGWGANARGERCGATEGGAGDGDARARSMGIAVLGGYITSLLATAKSDSFVRSFGRGRFEMAEVTKTPWHLWVVGILGLLWNLIAVTDYSFAKMKSEWYMQQVSGFKPEQIAWFDAFPLWANIGWALGVWGSFLGAVLLLARSRHATTAFIVSAVGLALMTLYQLGLHREAFVALFGPGPMIFTIVIWVILIAL